MAHVRRVGAHLRFAPSGRPGRNHRGSGPTRPARAPHGTGTTRHGHHTTLEPVRPHGAATGSVGPVTRLQIVGGGNMGEALLGGILDARWADPAEIVVVERLTDRCDELRALFPGVVVTDSVVASDGAVIAVKPADAAGATRAAVGCGATTVLSIAAGVVPQSSWSFSPMASARTCSSNAIGRLAFPLPM